MTSDAVPATERLRQMINGYQVTQAISAVATLGLADRLGSGRRSAEELAAETGCDARSLYRLLRALGAVGILREDCEGDARTFELTEVGQLLRRDVPGSLAGWAAFVARPYHWSTWGDLLHTVRTGEGAFAARHGESIWAWRERHPEESQIFDVAMSSIASAVSTRLTDKYDFGRFSSLADLGGGNGTLLATVLARHPALRGVLLDLPHVVRAATATLISAGVADRCDVLAGSFFDGVPPGCGAYLLKSILHDWDDDSSVRILRNVRQASEPGTVLLIVERILDDLSPSSTAAFSDLNMMVSTDGMERTLSEWDALATAGGFDISATVDIGLGWNAIEARRT